MALKVLPRGFGMSASSRERFLLEARAVARLRHPHIVSIHDVVDSGEVSAFAMEWVEGTSLSQLIEVVRELGGDSASVRMSSVLAREGGGMERDGAVGDEVWSVYVARVGIAIARALEAVHAAGMLHRDVKPSNVLVRRDGTALLSDFGLVREEGSTVHTVSGQFVGTPAYAAPEQLRGERALDARTDVYGLGATLYHALALRRAYVEESIPRILARIESGRVDPLRRVNPRLARDLETIVMKAMEADPGRRYAGARQLAEDLERLITLRPIHARASGPVARAAKLVRRNRGRVVGGFVGGVMALVAAGALVFVVFVAPRWHEREVRNARIKLISDGLTAGIFNRTYGGIALRHPVGGDEGQAARLADAMRHYEAAARLPVMGDGSIRLEREAVRLALDICGGGRAVVGPFVRDRAPLAASYVDRCVKGESFPEIPEASIRAASAEDLRTLGLIGALIGHFEVALAAWPELDTTPGNDPLVEAVLGYLYLMADRPALAYPRLRSASAAFPDVGFVHTYVADAAVGVGDYQRAERILADVERMERLDTMQAHMRVRLELYLATDRVDEAMAMWEEQARGTNHLFGNPLAVERTALALERRGEVMRAVRLAVSFPGVEWRETRAVMNRGAMPRFWSFERFVVGLCERWWDGLDAGDRVACLEAARDDASFQWYLLERYALARHRLATWPDRASLTLRGGDIGSGGDPVIDTDASWDDERAVAELPLAGVCARLDVEGALREAGVMPWASRREVDGSRTD